MSAAAATFDQSDARRPAVNPWIIALAVTLATFMEVLDTSIANVALPHIADSLSAGQDESTWVLTSFVVASLVPRCGLCMIPAGFLVKKSKPGGGMAVH